MSYLDKIDLSKVEIFPNKYWNKRAFCRFTDFYDGDTAVIVFYDGIHLIASQFRFYGYDAPEIKVPVGITDEERKERKEAAYAARDYLKEFTQSKRLIVQFSGNREKWGRLLGEVYYFDKCNDINEKCDESNSISTHMIQAGHGYPYQGGAKEKWDNKK